MNKIYYCKKCNGTFSGDDSQRGVKCPDCGINMVCTDYDVEMWRGKTPEEKATLKKYFRTLSVEIPDVPTENETCLAEILKGFGMVYIILAIFGAIVVAEAYELNFLVAIVIAVFASLQGILLMGFGEILKLLKDIKHKL